MSSKYRRTNRAYQCRLSDQPVYTYRDQSLALSLQEGTDFLKRKKLQFRLLHLSNLLCFLLLPFVGATILTHHYISVYQTYQQGICKIINKQVVELDSPANDRGDTDRRYYPSFSYIVYTASGQHALSSGYDGPTRIVDDANAGRAQAIINRHRIGEETSCWYNPQAPEKSFILFYGFTPADVALTFDVIFVGLGMVAAFVYLLLCCCIWKHYALWKRGVVTLGRVTKHEYGYFRHERHTVSYISFRTQEELDKERLVKVKGKLPGNKLFPVCYDPLFPLNRHYGKWPDRWVSKTDIIVVVLLMAIAILAVSYVWQLP